jgi:hypothetical protein
VAHPSVYSLEWVFFGFGGGPSPSASDHVEGKLSVPGGSSYEPSGACRTRKLLPPLDQTRINASFPLATAPNAC